MELVLNMLAEATTKEISNAKNPKTFKQSEEIAQKGGNIAGGARLEIEKQLERPVVSSKNSLDLIESKKKKQIAN